MGALNYILFREKGFGINRSFMMQKAAQLELRTPSGKFGGFKP